MIQQSRKKNNVNSRKAKGRKVKKVYIKPAQID